MNGGNFLKKSEKELEKQSIFVIKRTLKIKKIKIQNFKRAFIVEGPYDNQKIASYYLHENEANAHLALNFQLCCLSKSNQTGFSLSKTIQNLIDDFHSKIPVNCWPNWQLGNHDLNRIASRIGSQNVNLANVLNLLIGGTAVVYYGEEIGMQDLPEEYLKFNECQDERARKYGVFYYLIFVFLILFYFFKKG